MLIHKYETKPPYLLMDSHFIMQRQTHLDSTTNFMLLQLSNSWKLYHLFV